MKQSVYFPPRATKPTSLLDTSAIPGKSCFQPALVLGYSASKAQEESLECASNAHIPFTSRQDSPIEKDNQNQRNWPLINSPSSTSFILNRRIFNRT
ncbi:hypothetical protein DdX_12566 [Ditylenchus destructor]|uniref:Uncharacterized protein n=1 Tax=Ditylenchus destructor TaxID=166010 RepID=A0AAD4MUY9_9BILA|nr:hypothetical protein DdX_12566 [Ditylenchus destructor]